MPDFDLFDNTPLPPPSSLRSKRHDSKDPIPNPPSSNTKTSRPVDNFTAPFCPPYIIHFLTIETPHTDTFAVYGPHRTFAALVPAIRIAVAGSPSAILKLSTLQEEPDFENMGFTTFVIDLERQGYTVLRVVREVNVPVFDTLPAPVYIVTAYGPVFHDMGTGLRTVASGKPKGVAATGKIVGTWITVDEARAAAKQQMDMLVYGEEGVMRMEKGEIGGKGRRVLMGMNSKAVWEVSVSSEHQHLLAKPSLALADTGKEAWLFLTACWAVETLTFGFAASFGVYLDFYSRHKLFAGSGYIAVIGNTTSGIMYMGTPLVLIICRLYPRFARWCTFIGLIAASLSIATSSFCTSMPQLIVTQGMAFGVSSCFASCPSTLYIDEWFVHRKGLAYGIVWSAAGFGGVVLPLLLETLLSNFEFRTATRIWATVLFVCSISVGSFVKPRLPYDTKTINTGHNMRFVTSKMFIVNQAANVVQSTGVFLPIIYLPTYARMFFGASTLLSALTIIMLNLATTVGMVIMGFLSDKLQVTTYMFISAAGGATSVLVIWGLAPSLPVFYMSCVVYGLSAGSWASIWPGIMREVSQSGETDPVMVQGHLCVGRGFANMISGPLSNWLIRGMPWQGKAPAGYGSEFGVLIFYTGVTAILSGMTFLWKRLNFL